eukprot:TRINITY_DN14126_c0_g1_i1.p1 TRINITY_DN14126_c0_g1~~TRINITY_DN14126_c0_g1_i1.p1  ORF type:complete len:239 (+),score=25.99 TRINITY_DN14126_c0_g1_i1:43-759(+)
MWRSCFVRLALFALAAATSAHIVGLYSELKQEFTTHAGVFAESDIDLDYRGFYVFLQKFPLTGTFLGIKAYHTEVLVCPRAGFAPYDQQDLDDMVSGMSDFVEVDPVWWQARPVPCIELGYGGNPCSMRCCGVVAQNMALNVREALITNADLSRKEVYFYGAGSFDGITAYHRVCDQKCWSEWTGSEYSILTTNCNTFTSTVLSCVYGLSQKKPKLGFSDMVTVHGNCPSTVNATAAV